MPGISVNALPASSHLCLMTTLGGRYYYYPDFTEDETEAWRLSQLPEVT